ncbi:MULTISPECIES: hypothetical protein [unclassified Haloferax]|uniref:hypothetical protein n=1 Tax=unclassified Haloferax TaxID=2625095 RepID=UPI0011C054CF|nr:MULTISPECIES: hypothetical protein [unclassified Haloferax]
MPVNTDSDSWQSGDEPPRLEVKIIDFLKEHPDEAFRLREIADEVVDTSWSEVERFNRKQDQLEREELEKEYPLDEDHPSTLSEFRPTDRLQAILRQLEGVGLVETRLVDVGAFSEAYLPDLDEVIAYTYSTTSD